MSSNDKRPNILWYCTDQQRFDTIRSLGNPYINTPNLDRLVSNGVAFIRAYTQSPICTPSRATFLTGRYQVAHQVYRNGTDRFPDTEKLVTKIFAEAGYDCGLAGKFHLSRAKDRVEIRPDDGYRVFHWSHHPYPWWEEGHAYADWLVDEKGVDPDEIYPAMEYFGPGVPTELHQTTWCTEMAIRFITEERESPWLFSVNVFDPHPPFDPPQEYLERYNPVDLPAPLFRKTDIERQRAFINIDQQSPVAVNPTIQDSGEKVSEVTGSINPADTPPDSYDGRVLKAHYYAMIELIDDQFGRIIETLRSSGQLENTLIIFMSDHGELLGDHGLLYKGCRFFEALVHVPLIMAWGDVFEKDLKSDALVELIDLAPTILEAAGLQVPENMQGKSLFPLLKGITDPDIHKPYVISEFKDALSLSDGSHGSMYFDGRYKICVYHQHNLGELYDLENDPGEFDNLWDDPESQKLKMDLFLKHFDAMMATTDGFPRSDKW